MPVTILSIADTAVNAAQPYFSRSSTYIENSTGRTKMRTSDRRLPVEARTQKDWIERSKEKMREPRKAF